MATRQKTLLDPLKWLGAGGGWWSPFGTAVAVCNYQDGCRGDVFSSFLVVGVLGVSRGSGGVGVVGADGGERGWVGGD